MNLDEVLEALDTDTRAYLRMLLVGGGRGRGDDLGELLGSLGPVNRDLAKLNREVAKRRDNLANLIHNMNLLFGRVGQEDEEIAALIDASNPRWARSPRRTSTCAARPASSARRARARVALEETGKLAEVLGPALNDLRPFARRLKPVNDSLGKLARETTGDVEPDPAVHPRRARASPRPAARCREPERGDPGPDDGRPAAEQDLQHGRLQPQRSRGPGTPRPRRGLPVLARLARPSEQHVLAAGRRRLPQALSGLHLRRGGRHPGHSPLALITGLGPVFAAGAPCGP